jgi:anthraniloyl-CoA monooxygenase
MKAAAWRRGTHCPPQYEPGQEQIMRNSIHDRADLDDLKLRGRPKTRAEMRMERAGG